MKCPSCNEGELFLYKETECVYRVPLTNRNTFSKQKLENIPQVSDTSKVYLECEGCGESFEYALDDKGRVINRKVSWSVLTMVLNGKYEKTN